MVDYNWSLIDVFSNSCTDYNLLIRGFIVSVVDWKFWYSRWLNVLYGLLVFILIHNLIYNWYIDILVLILPYWYAYWYIYINILILIYWYWYIDILIFWYCMIGKSKKTEFLGNLIAVQSYRILNSVKSKSNLKFRTS